MMMARNIDADDAWPTVISGGEFEKDISAGIFLVPVIVMDSNENAVVRPIAI